MRDLYASRVGDVGEIFDPVAIERRVTWQLRKYELENGPLVDSLAKAELPEIERPVEKQALQGSGPKSKEVA